MDEEIKNNGEEIKVDEASADLKEDAGTEEQKEEKATAEQLMTQIAQLKADNQRLQNKYNQASSEAAKSKQALRAKQTAEEREAEEIAEQKRLADEEKENMRKELNHIKAVAAYKDIQEEGTVELLIEAVSESDHNAIAAILKNEVEKAVKEAVKAEKTKWLKENPPANVGTGEQSAVTKDQLRKMNYQQRVEFYNKNPELYSKLTESEDK